MKPKTPEQWLENYVPWVTAQTKDMNGIATRPGEFQNRYARLMWAAALREAADIGYVHATSGVNPSSKSIAAGAVFQVAGKCKDSIIKRAEELEKV